VPSPAEAPVRKLMYELFAKEKRMKAVARILNESGYRTRSGARFTDTTVIRLIQDSTAQGVYRANYTELDATGKLRFKAESEWVYTPVEPVVSEDLWRECNDILEARKGKRPVGPKPVQLFGGLLHCACGSKMYVFVRSPKYVCPKCRNKIPIVDLEGIFKDELEQFFVSREKIESHLAQANGLLVEKKQLVAAHEQQTQKVRAEMRKVYELYQSDQISPDGFGKLYKPLEAQERSLASELPKLQGEVDALEVRHVSAEEVAAEAVNLHRLWPDFTLEEKRRIVESITEKITVGPGEIDITFSYAPTSEELTKRQRNLQTAIFL
jgi:site-specific DNA recombinase